MILLGLAALGILVAIGTRTSGGSSLGPITFIQAKHFTPTNGRTIKWIVIHDAETPEQPGAARAVAQYFATVERPASAHYEVDNLEIVQSVQDKDVAYAAPPMNDQGLHIELAGYASQTADDWANDYSESMLQLAAQLVSAKAQQYGVPLNWLSVEDLQAGTPGIVSHATISQAFHQSTHTDPGPNFPVDHFMDLVRAA